MCTCACNICELNVETTRAHRYRERGNIEAHFFNIQARLKANGQRMYVPPEGMLIRDIESAWLVLEKAEHDRELALRQELIRQERLEQLAVKFEKKVRTYVHVRTAAYSYDGSNTCCSGV